MSQNRNSNKTHFIFGTADLFSIENSDDIVVLGRVTGKASVGDTVSITNFGEDAAPVFTSEITAIDINHETFETAEDCMAGLRIKNGARYHLKTSTVIYRGNPSADEKYANFASSIMAKINFTGIPTDSLDRYSLSEYAEIIRLECIAMKQKNTIEAVNRYRNLLDEMAPKIKEKLFASDYIYCVYCTATGDPFLSSSVYSKDDGLASQPPLIQLITEAFLPLAVKKYSSDLFEIKRIDNGADKTGIKKFLGDCFFVYGAAGFSMLYEDASVLSFGLIDEADHKKNYPLPVPVCNPEICALTNLIIQMGIPKNKDESIVTGFYFNVLGEKLPEASLLIPVRSELVKNENGTVSFEGDGLPDLPVIKTDEDRFAVPVFTDIIHMLNLYGNDYNAVSGNLASFTEKYDLMINPSESNPEGCYISKEMAEHLNIL